MATKAALRIILLLVASLGLHKQTLAQDHIALGQSIVTLNGPWKFQIGDNPRWASLSGSTTLWTLTLVQRKQLLVSSLVP